MSKEKYVLDRVKMLVTDRINTDQMIKPCNLDELIDQWEFDYEVEE